MKRKFLLVIIVISLFVIQPLTTYSYHLKNIHDDAVKLLLVYTNKSKSQTANVQQLDYMLHHFTEQVTVISDDQLDRTHLEQATHLIYYGEDEQQLNPSSKHLLQSVKIPIIAIGHNATQFNLLEKNRSEEIVNIERIHDSKEQRNIHLEQTLSIKHIKQEKNAFTHIYLFGAKGHDSYPLLGKIDENYYFSLIDLTKETVTVLAELFHDLLPVVHSEEQQTYIMIDGIQPFTDPDHLLNIGTYFIEKEIPFLLNVQPFIQSIDGKSMTTLDESKELVKVLQQLQTRDGSIVLDSHLLKANESLNLNKSMSHFPNVETYEQYLQKQRATEEEMLKDAIERATHELLKVDLYPLAVHLSDELMFAENYKVISNYFETLFKSDRNIFEEDYIFRPMPFLSTASYLKDMIVYPLTMSMNSVATDLSKELSLSFDTFNGIMFPVDGTIDQLDRYINVLDQLDQINWLNLRHTNLSVQIDQATIQTDNLGHISVDDYSTWWDRITDYRESLSFFEKVLWTVTIVVIVFISLFLLFALHLRTQLKKRLFMERKSNG